MKYSSEFATDEAHEAAQLLGPLIKETRGLLGNLAARGIRQLKRLSADEPYPTTITEEGPNGGIRFFARRQIVRTVSPKINGELNIDGYPTLMVVSAAASYYKRQHFAQHFVSLRGPGSATISLPFSRSKEDWLTLGIRSKQDTRPTGIGTYPVGMSTRGDVRENGWHYIEPKKPFNSPHLYTSADQVNSSYGEAFAESLALGGLIAHGMRAFRINLDTAPVKNLLDEWRAILKQEPVTRDAFWLESGNRYLIDYQPRGE